MYTRLRLKTDSRHLGTQLVCVLHILSLQVNTNFFTVCLAPGGTLSKWRESYERAARLVDQMSLIEKANITTGTGWMMGPCVGNTGAPKITFHYIAIR